MGVYTALRRDTWLAQVLLAASLVGVSPADVPDRHPADPGVRGACWAGCRRSAAAKRCALGWWTHRPAHHERAEGADPAGDHAVAVPDDADHAAGALRNARGAAHRLHQVRARARADRPRDPFRPCAEEHAGAGDHDHRPAARRDHRVRHHHRDRVPVARHGTAVHPGGAASPTSR